MDAFVIFALMVLVLSPSATGKTKANLFFVLVDDQNITSILQH
jgi:hypothetical protein